MFSLILSLSAFRKDSYKVSLTHETPPYLSYIRPNQTKMKSGTFSQRVPKMHVVENMKKTACQYDNENLEAALVSFQTLLEPFPPLLL